MIIIRWFEQAFDITLQLGSGLIFLVSLYFRSNKLARTVEPCLYYLDMLGKRFTTYKHHIYQAYMFSSGNTFDVWKFFG